MRLGTGLASVGMLGVLSACAKAPECPESAFDADAMRSEVAYLASEELDGRVPGTAGDAAARALVRERFTCLGLTPLDGLGGFEQAFVDSRGRETANVLGSLPGADAELADEVVVLSAHLDHLGDGLLGANDNASGVSGLMAIAQAFTERDEAPARTVLFAAFGAEESGMEGATAFMDGLAPEDIVYSVNMDMIGSYASTGTVWALGALDRTPGRSIVEALREDYPELDIGVGAPSDLSDNEVFCSEGIPYLFFWTEDPECYHAACDTADRIDHDEMIAIARLTGDTTWELANSGEDLRGAVQSDTNVCGVE